MNLQGSCKCKKVQFRAISNTPYPYMRCYCSFCHGSGGYGINILANKDENFVISQGKEFVKIFESSPGSHRHFCSECGSHLWNYHPDWPKWIYPYASAIDTDLPDPPFAVHILLDSRASWVPVQRISESMDQLYDHYPEDSIEQWHKKNGLWVDKEPTI